MLPPATVNELCTAGELICSEVINMKNSSGRGHFVCLLGLGLVFFVFFTNSIKPDILCPMDDGKYQKLGLRVWESDE